MSGVHENNSRRFSLDEIRKATNDFNEILGAGGFGKVYKGVIDDESTNTLVAVKRTLDANQGSVSLETEIQMLSKCKHSNIVSLLGYCNEDQDMILVYEYMPQGNLGDHLYGDKGTLLSWEQRLNICIGAARGLDYLHTGTGLSDIIVHLDIKSDNILLDDNLAAKIADLGLSQIGPANQPKSQVETGIRGTQGYMDPQYFTTHTYSRKSDVYSFGVVLLEVLCGTCQWQSGIIPESNRADWIQQHISRQTLDQIVDPKIVSGIQRRSLNRFASTARKALQLDSVKRPAMTTVVAELVSALELQSSSSVVDGDDLFEFGYEGETSGNSAPDNAPNVFGETIGNKQTMQMGLQPTRADRALAAYRSAKPDLDKHKKAVGFLQDLAAKAGDGFKTLCMIYNATGETINYVTSRNLYGEARPYTYPINIHNGQWGVFLHIDNSFFATGSVGGVVYRVKNSDNAFCDQMVTWCTSLNLFSSSNSAYCEINEVGHFDVTDWDAIFRKAQGTGEDYQVTWNNCVTEVSSRYVNPSAFCAAFTQVGVIERCAEIDKAN